MLPLHLVSRWDYTLHFLGSRLTLGSLFGPGRYHARNTPVEDCLDRGDKQEGKDWRTVGDEHGRIVSLILFCITQHRERESITDFSKRRYYAVLENHDSLHQWERQQ